MRYCAQHNRAYQPYTYGAFTASGKRGVRQPPHWRPFPRTLVALALRWVRDGGCTLVVTLEACDQCGEEESSCKLA